MVTGILACIILSTLLTGCSKVGFSNVAGPLCTKTANLAATSYAKATTPSAQKIAEKAVDAAIAAGSEVAKLVANGKPGIAKNIEDILTRLRARKTATNATGDTITALRGQKAVVSSSLTDLGNLCASAVKTATK